MESGSGCGGGDAGATVGGMRGGVFTEPDCVGGGTGVSVMASAVGALAGGVSDDGA